MVRLNICDSAFPGAGDALRIGLNALAGANARFTHLSKGDSDVLHHFCFVRFDLLSILPAAMEAGPTTLM
jgi:hypothetical protein